MEEINLIDIADDLLIVNKTTIDKLFQLDNAADCIALYMFYYKTAKWQKTNQPKANDKYVKECLKWGKSRLISAKHALQENGLIEIIQARKDGKISGWYVKVSYLISQEKIKDIKIKTINEDINKYSEQQVLECTSTEQNTNTLKVNNKYLKKENNINTINSINNEKSKNQKSNRHIEIYNFLTEYLKDEDEDIRKAINDYVNMRKNNYSKGKLTVDKLKGILTQFEEDYKNAPKQAILEQLRRATNLQWTAISFQPYNKFNGNTKSSYSSQPIFDNTANHNIRVYHITDEEFEKLTFEEKMKEIDKFDATADMTKKQYEFFKENCLARDENGNLLEF